MKKIVFLAIAAGFTLGSCSSDDDEASQGFSLTGVWHPSRQIEVSGSNGVTISNEAFSACYQTSTYNFKADNNLTINIFEANTTTGSCVSAGVETVPYTYSHDQNSLIIDGENVEIVSRTENEIHLVSHYEDVDGDDIDDKIIFVLSKT